MAPILASTAIVLSFALLRAAPLPLQGMQSMDDQTMADWVSANEGEEQLAARYESMAQVLKPGLRRYNAFWSAVEPSASFPPGSPPTCPSRSILAPASEADRVRLSYHRFHCYDAATILHFDDYLARDAAIGAASAFIVYGSPAWVAVSVQTVELHAFARAGPGRCESRHLSPTRPPCPTPPAPRSTLAAPASRGAPPCTRAAACRGGIWTTGKTT